MAQQLSPRTSRASEATQGALSQCCLRILGSKQSHPDALKAIEG